MNPPKEELLHAASVAASIAMNQKNLGQIAASYYVLEDGRKPLAAPTEKQVLNTQR